MFKSFILVFVLTILSLAPYHPCLQKPYVVSQNQKTVTVTLTATVDAYVDKARPSENFGSGESLEVRSWLTKNARALILFDLSRVPPGAAVEEASLSLYATSSLPERVYHCYRIGDPWDEDSVTWSNMPQATLRYETETSIDASTGWVTWDITQQARQLLTGIEEHAWTNYGWMIKDIAEDSDVVANASFISRESLVEEKRPYLTLSFTPPKFNLTSEVTSTIAGNWVRMTVDRISQDGVLIVIADRVVKQTWINIDNLKVKLSSSSPSGRFSLTVDGDPINEVSIPNGAAQVSFYYLCDPIGDHVISVNTDDYPQGYYEGDSRTLTVIEDVTPPEISKVAKAPESPVMGESVKISATIRDVDSGVKDAVLHYSTSGGTTWTDVEMAQLGDTYEAHIPGQNLFTEVSYYIESFDLVGNMATTPVETFTAGIPIWVYVVVGVGVTAAILIVTMVLRRRKT